MVIKGWTWTSIVQPVSFSILLPVCPCGGCTITCLSVGYHSNQNLQQGEFHVLLRRGCRVEATSCSPQQKSWSPSIHSLERQLVCAISCPKLFIASLLNPFNKTQVHLHSKDSRVDLLLSPQMVSIKNEKNKNKRSSQFQPATSVLYLCLM